MNIKFINGLTVEQWQKEKSVGHNQDVKIDISKIDKDETIQLGVDLGLFKIVKS